jgi:hypothetical protein
MKVIFLDIDGVVNCYDTKERAPSKVIGVEQRLITYIKEIVDATGAELVLSSTWRKDWAFNLMDGKDWFYLRDEFAKQDLQFLDYTPSRRDSWRGEEIKEWLESTEYDVESYVIIDDEMFDIWDLHEGHMVQTSDMTGIKPGAVKMAIEILSKQHNAYND